MNNKVLKSRDPLEVAEAVLKACRARLVYQSGSYFEWDGAAYQALDRDALRSRLYVFLGKRTAPDGQGKRSDYAPNRTKINDVEDALKALINLPADTKTPAWLDSAPPNVAPLDIIAFRNGLLHVPSRQLLDPTPDFYTHNALPFDYDPVAPEPFNWIAFVLGLFPDDPDSVQLLQEWTGLLLTNQTRFQKILLVVGPPRSGKGVWARTVRKLVGPSNYIAPTLTSFAGYFGSQGLIGKTVAVISDARTSGRMDRVAVTERLLAISGEDSPAIPRKMLADWQGDLSIRFTITTNELPELKDASGALLSRFLLLQLTESHLGQEDTELEERFDPELPGIVNWALEGLERLQERGRFVQPESGQTMLDALAEDSAPVRAFIEQRCEVGPEYQVPRAALFDSWKDWCEETGHYPGDASTFGRELRAALPTVRDRWKGSERVYGGLQVRGFKVTFSTGGTNR